MRLVVIGTGWGEDMFSDETKCEQWYWVTDGSAVWPAVYDPRYAGGWTNRDTWEDFDGSVLSWKAIDNPSSDGWTGVSIE